MNDEAHTGADASDDAKGTRERSSIAFPYWDFSEAAKLADSIHSNVGNGTCSLVQLAAWTNQSSKSSGYRGQVAASRLFGLIDSEGTDSYRLTPLGKQLIDPNTSRKAKAEAFLNVPLFAAIYKNHKDGVLPPANGLEREIGGLGVSEKQRGRARQIFERSAEQTGFFEHGKNRLILPAIAIKDTAAPNAQDRDDSGNGNNSSGWSGDGFAELMLDPLLMALLRKIPSVEDGWAKDKRIRWFKTFAMNVSQVYDDDDDPVEISVSEASQPK